MGVMTTTDIGDILYQDCKAFGIEVFRYGNIPEGEITEDRVVIISKPQSPDTYWKKSFVEVNICVPDIGSNKANLTRLGKYEEKAINWLDDIVSFYNGYTYRYTIDSIGIEKDTEMKCHYVNVRILFELLNVK